MLAFRAATLKCSWVRTDWPSAIWRWVAPTRASACIHGFELLAGQGPRARGAFQEPTDIRHHGSDRPHRMMKIRFKRPRQRSLPTAQPTTGCGAQSNNLAASEVQIKIFGAGAPWTLPTGPAAGASMSTRSGRTSIHRKKFSRWVSASDPWELALIGFWRIRCRLIHARFGRRLPLFYAHLIGKRFNRGSETPSPFVHNVDLRQLHQSRQKRAYFFLRHVKPSVTSATVPRKSNTVQQHAERNEQARVQPNPVRCSDPQDGQQ